MNILLIKLGALGDVLRTTSLVPALKQKWPPNFGAGPARLTWLTAESALPLVNRHPDVDERVTIESVEAGETDLAGRNWHAIVNLDEDAASTRIARDLPAREKFGVTRDAAGRLMPLSPLSETLVQLATDDRMKFRENQMPYQALIFAACGMAWPGSRYIYVPPVDIAARRAKLFQRGEPARLVGVFVGASDRFANKFWNEDEIAAFCAAFRSVASDGSPGPAGRRIVLFGGPAERDRLARLAQNPDCRPLHRICVDSIDDMAAAISAFDMVVCGDTLAMHLADALGVRTVMLFGPTSSAEIATGGQKIISPYSCGPCYLRTCGIRPSCMSAISPERVLAAL